MKVIFLDVDGILNCRFTRERIHGFIFVMDRKVEMLKSLVDATGARIILSSTWRQGYYDMHQKMQNRNVDLYLALKDKLLDFGLEIMDCTPIIAYDQRGAEIDKWLREWDGEPIESFVILDDMNGRYLRPHANRLVRTSMKEGLQEKHVELAKKILDKPWEEKL